MSLQNPTKEEAMWTAFGVEKERLNWTEALVKYGHHTPDDETPEQALAEAFYPDQTRRLANATLLGAVAMSHKFGSDISKFDVVRKNYETLLAILDGEK